MLALQRVDDIDPVCPHCDEPLGTVCFRELKSIAGKRYVYFCASCLRVLGVSHRKGFLMG